jgi:hypothetical protein
MSDSHASPSASTTPNSSAAARALQKKYMLVGWNLLCLDIYSMYCISPFSLQIKCYRSTPMTSGILLGASLA